MRSKFLTLGVCLFSALTLLAPHPPAAAATLLATTGNGSSGPSTLLEIDPVTGATLQTIGPVGYIVNGLEFDPATGKLYGSTSYRDPNYNGLIEIDMSTGAGTPIGPSGWGWSGVPAENNCGLFSPVTNITLDSGGQMYGWLDPCADDLVRIDKTTGIATWVGDALGYSGTARNGLDFDSSDTLYMIQFGNVYQVNVTTGWATYIGSYPTTAWHPHHGDFDPATDLYYAIGPTTGPGIKFLEVVDISTMTVVATVPLQNEEIHVITFVGLIEVDIDIKFCSNPNGYNCKSRGVTPVTIFGTPSFDVSDIDIGSLRLCEAADLTNCTDAPVNFSIADRGDPMTDLGAAMCAIDPLTGEELDWLNQDGFADMDVAFRTQEVVSVIGCDGLDKGNASLTLVLIGQTVGGTPITSVPIGDVGIDQLLIQKN